MKTYTFTDDELLVLRNALVEYKSFIRPDEGATERRVQIFHTASALADQFKQDIMRRK